MVFTWFSNPKWYIFVGTFCGQFLLSLVSRRFLSDHFYWTFLLKHLCWYFLPAFFVSAFRGHFFVGSFCWIFFLLVFFVHSWLDLFVQWRGFWETSNRYLFYILKGHAVTKPCAIKKEELATSNNGDRKVF